MANVRTAYLSDREMNLITLEGVDILKDVMLLNAGCGYGKTTLILNWNKDEETLRIYELINAKRKELGLPPTNHSRTLIATSRTAIYEQMVHDIGQRLFNTHKDVSSEVRANLTNEEQYEWAVLQGHRNILPEDIPQLTTFARLANAIQKGTFVNNYDMIVVDEAHSLVLDTVFADNNYYVLKWLEQQENMVKLFMTATPDIWTKFVKENKHIGPHFNFKQINPPLPAKYQADSVKFIYGTTLGFMLSYYEQNNVFDEENKCLAFTNTAHGAIKRMVDDSTGRTMALISKYSSGSMEITRQQEDNIRKWDIAPQDNFMREHFLTKLEDSREVKLSEIMAINQSRINKLSKEGVIAEGIAVLIATSAFREGISIKDKKLQYVFSEYLDNANLVQGINRGRHNELKEIVVILNGNFKDNTLRQKADIDEFLCKYQAAQGAERTNLLRDRYEEQSKPFIGGLNKAKIVVEVKEQEEDGDRIRYEINHYLYAYYAYMEFHYLITDELSPIKTIEENGNVVQIEKWLKYANSGEKLPTWKEYYTSLLAPYSREGIVRFHNDKMLRKAKLALDIEQANQGAMGELETMLQPYLGVELDSTMKQELVEMANNAGMVRSMKKQIGWPTLKSAIEELGYAVVEKRKNNKRCVVIQK